MQRSSSPHAFFEKDNNSSSFSGDGDVEFGRDGGFLSRTMSTEEDPLDHLVHFENWRQHKLTKEERELMESYEGLDYDVVENELRRMNLKKKTKWQSKLDYFFEWLVFLFIGIGTGFTAFLIFMGVRYLSKLRFDASLYLLLLFPRHPAASYLTAYAVYAFSAVLLVGISSFLVAFIEPIAGGSGIPELKAYLNGTNLHNFVRLKTFFVKAVGVILSVSGGLTIGKEGPLVHTGSCLSANLSHLPKSNVKRWRTDYYKRNFISGGAAAGVAAAFGAPVGGTLFSFEEASSYWHLQLTWQVFFCAMLSTFTLNIFLSIAGGDPIHVNNPGLVTFRSFVPSAYTLYEIPIFAFLGVVRFPFFFHIFRSVQRFVV